MLYSVAFVVPAANSFAQLDAELIFVAKSKVSFSRYCALMFSILVTMSMCLN